MVEVKVNDKRFDALYKATFNFLLKCLPHKSRLIKNEKQLLNELKKNQNKIFNVTPNGMIVPKKELCLEFNLVVKSYINILEDLNIKDLIQDFHFPPNLRIKYKNIKKNHLKRKHPTELFHADTWTGAMPNWVASHFFIIGDVKNNNIEYASPPKDFQEDWLKPIEKNEDGQIFAQKFKKINYTPKKGSFILADASVVHRSFRTKNCGIRVSLDTGINMKIRGLKSFKPVKINKINVKKLREDETINKDEFFNIGSNNFLYFPDSMHKKNSTLGGFKHPSNLRLIKS